MVLDNTNPHEKSIRVMRPVWNDYSALARGYNSWMREVSGETEGIMWTPLPTHGMANLTLDSLRRAMEREVRTGTVTEEEYLRQILLHARLLPRDSLSSVPQYLRRTTGGNAWEGGDTSQWFTDVDISDIMADYARRYPDYAFLGAVPSDCSQYPTCSIANANFEELYAEGKRQFGVVYNRDIVGNSGTHWVGLYLAAPKDGENLAKIYFCDSAGKPPSPAMFHFLEAYEKWCRSHGWEVEERTNTIRYQKDKTECGVYSCYFIIRLLGGDQFDQIVGDRPDYDLIRSCRKLYLGQDGNYHPTCDPGRPVD